MANFMLRIDDNLHKELKEIAEKDKRSLTKEIEYILTKYLEKEKGK